MYLHSLNSVFYFEVEDDRMDDHNPKDHTFFQDIRELHDHEEQKTGLDQMNIVQINRDCVFIVRLYTLLTRRKTRKTS